MNGIRVFTGVLVMCLLAMGVAAQDDAKLKALIAPGAKVVKLAGDFTFTEGPAVDKAGNVFFTDVREQKIHKWSVDGKLSTHREDTGGANGLFFDKDGNLLACEGDAGRVTRQDKKGAITVLADTFGGKRFNKPNDLWIDPKGGVYFTDPLYGRDAKMSQPAMNVYYIPPGGKVTRVIEDVTKPNGILGTPDGKKLYVADPGAKTIWLYPIGKDGLGERKKFAEIGCDGMTMDQKGNVYFTENGVVVYSPKGERLGAIATPERPANVVFGGKDRKTLFITARTSLYAIDMAVTGAVAKKARGGKGKKK